jgi:phosphatidate cytidylyltransferase
MHFKRVVSALIFVPLFYLYVTYLPPEYFLFLLAFVSTVALAEFYTMAKIGGVLKYAGVFCGAALLAAFFAGGDLFAAALLLSVLSLMALRLFLKRDPASSLAEISVTVLGLLYIPSLLTFQIGLIKVGPAWLLLLYASVWIADSMAYYVGKGIGKRKLYVEVSPNKTVAGAVGSFLGGILGALIIKAVMLHQMPVVHTMLIGAAVGIVSVIGDLVESMFKRDAGVKDSSNIIPGHGGVLDKLDSFIFTGPVFYWLCSALGLIP